MTASPGSLRPLVLTVAAATLALSGTLAFARTASTASTTSTSTAPTPSTATAGDAHAIPGSRATLQPIVTVRAARRVRHEIVGRDYAGVPIEQLSLTREVGYHDLNLNSPEGIVTLRHRIDMTARQACRELSSLYASRVWTSTNRACVHDAIDGAVAQLPSSVAAAVGPARGALR